MPAPESPTVVPLVVEADTAEEALVLVRERLGDDAEVVEARKVHRGGWKGFFALERVELTARPRTGVPRPVAIEALPSAPDVDEDVADVRRQLEAEEQRDRADFDRMLRRLLEPPPAEPAEPVDAVVTGSRAEAPAPTEPSAPIEPPLATSRIPHVASPPAVGATVGWSCAALEGLRMPSPVVDACRGLHPADDLAWVAAIADVVGPWCRPLPAGASAYVGPRVGRLATALDLRRVGIGEIAPANGPVALEAPDTATGRAWATRQAGDRWLHAVVSAGRWHGFMFEDVLAVSWLADDQLPMALSMASRLGVVLGHGPAGRDRTYVRATPIDVALAIRALLPRI